MYIWISTSFFKICHQLFAYKVYDFTSSEFHKKILFYLCHIVNCSFQFYAYSRIYWLYQKFFKHKCQKNNYSRVSKYMHAYKKSLKIPKGNQNRKSKKDRLYNGKRKTNKDLQNTAQKSKDWATRILLKTGILLLKGRQFLLH